MLLRVVGVAAAAGLAAAETCAWQRNGENCPGTGATCNGEMLCIQGGCVADVWGDLSWSGVCRIDGPELQNVYNTPCDPARPVDCVYYNPLSLTPRAGPSYLQCVREQPGDKDGRCRLAANNHGDACNVDAECASRRCLKEIRLCRGIDSKMACTPGLFPDQCGRDLYCAPSDKFTTGGECQPVATAGRTCRSSTACEKGYYCAGSSLSSQKRCVAPFTFPDGQNVTIGPYMCASANAIVVEQGPNSVDSVYRCLPGNATLTGSLCDSSINATTPAGYSCQCASDGQMRLRTVNGLGIGSRSVVWRNLYECLMSATNIMGAGCEFDQIDMERVRYGSCAYYGCYPYYLQLVNATGGRFFTEPLAQFEPFAKCEVAAATRYYASVFQTPCLAIPNMENWRCATLVGAHSLSVGSTTAVVSFILVFIVFAYWAHMYYHRKVYAKLAQGGAAGELGA